MKSDAIAAASLFVMAGVLTGIVAVLALEKRIFPVLPMWRKVGLGALGVVLLIILIVVPLHYRKMARRRSFPRVQPLSDDDGRPLSVRVTPSLGMNLVTVGFSPSPVRVGHDLYLMYDPAILKIRPPVRIETRFSNFVEQKWIDELSPVQMGADRALLLTEIGGNMNRISVEFLTPSNLTNVFLAVVSKTNGMVIEKIGLGRA